MKSIETKNQSPKGLTPSQERKAYEAAYSYYSSKLSDGSLDSQRNVALKNGIAPPRFSEALANAWRAGMVDVIINPPGNSPDHIKMRYLETKLEEKLIPYSVGFNANGVDVPRLKKVHIIPAASGLPLEAGPDNSDLADSTRAHICRRAAREFLQLLLRMYSKKNRLHVGMSWGRTCQAVLNVLPIPLQPLNNLVACPLIGIIGHRDTPLDANTLAYRLGSSLSGAAIKLPLPCIRPVSLKGLEDLRPVVRAFEEINRCQVGLSSVAAVHNQDGSVRSSLEKRKMLDPDEILRLKEMGAVAEIHCHFFDIDGRAFTPEELGFVPMAIGIENMRKMERFMIVVRPEKEKILPAIVAIKAGICTDLVLDHRIAYYILNDENDKELGL